MKRQSQLQQISKTLLVSRIDKSGSLVKLQQVLGHSSTSISYLFKKHRSAADEVGGPAQSLVSGYA